MEHAIEAAGDKGAHVQQAEVGQIIKEDLKMKLTEQDVLCLTNNEKRKAVLEAWREWPVWADMPEIGLTVHRLDLPGGGAFMACWYAGDDFFPGGGTKNANRPRFRLIGHGGKLAHGSQAESVLLEQLQQIRAELVKRTGKRG